MIIYVISVFSFPFTYFTRGIVVNLNHGEMWFQHVLIDKDREPVKISYIFKQQILNPAKNKQPTV